MFDRLSEELKQAREKSGLTLQQLTNKTKIDIKFLQAMEDGNFSFQPDLYVRAFLKSYAKFVGLDENLMVRKYQSIKEGKPYHEPENLNRKETLLTEEKINPVPKSSYEQKKRPPEREEPVKQSIPRYENTRGGDFSDQGGFNKRNVVILAGIACILVLFALIYYFFFRSDNDIIVTEKPYEEIVEEGSDRYADLEPKVDTTTVNTEQGYVSDSLKLLINTSDTSWVKITIDNTRSDEFVLFPGGQKTITAKDNYRIVFGNSKSIKLHLNNKPLDFVSPGRKVTSILVDTSGVRFASAPVKKQG